MEETQARKRAADFPQETWDRLAKDRNQMRHIEGETRDERKAQRWL